MRILLVEDDEKLGTLFDYKLNQAYHEVDWVQESDTARTYMTTGPYDLYVLDCCCRGSPASNCASNSGPQATERPSCS